MGKTSGSGNKNWTAAGIHTMRTDPEAKKKVIDNLRRTGQLDPEVCRQRRKRQIKHEESEAKRLRTQGYEVYHPTVVCDRIAIKDGKVFFVEFKRPGQKLRTGQQAVQTLVPKMYIVQFSKK